MSQHIWMMPCPLLMVRETFKMELEQPFSEIQPKTNAVKTL
jgi:hypothetical protein